MIQCSSDIPTVSIGGIRVSIEEITPKMAESWLSTANTKNRRLRERLVMRYATDMVNGDWVLSHQGIAFDTDLALIDGQHRLSAIALSGETVRMLVFRGMTARSRMAVDAGMKRMTHDQLNMGGAACGHVGPQHISVTRAMIRGMASSANKWTDAQIGRFIEQHRDAITFGMDTLPKTKKVGTSEVRALIARAYYHGDHAKIDRFCEALHTGMMDGPDQAIAIRLRNTLMTLEHAGGTSMSVRYAKASRALRAYLDGEDITRIFAAKHDEFPLPEAKAEVKR